jgi:hypothetical protein
MVGHVLSTSAARTIFEQMLLIDLPRPAGRHAAGPGWRSPSVETRM